jgi:membrane fusion protein
METLLPGGENEGLFRQDVIDARSRRLHGAVIVQKSVPTRILTAAIVVIVVAAAVWVVTGRYARLETARGVLSPVQGASRIFAMRPGVVTSLRVSEGEQVSKGQALAVVTVETPNALGAIPTNEELGSNATQTALAATQIELSAKRSVNEVERLNGAIEGLRQQARTVRDQLQIQQELVASTTTNFEQITGVVQKGFVSRLELERRRQAMLNARQELSRLQQQAGAIAAETAKTGNERARAALDGQNDQAATRRTMEELRQQRSRIQGSSSYLIEAPITGRVTALQTAPGSTVSTSMPLMVIIPDGAELRADLFVPSSAVGFIKQGQEVRLLYDAFPFQRFGSHVGRVSAISRVAIAGPEINAPFKIDEPVYRVTATLDRQYIEAYGVPTDLQPGMTLVANLVLERQSFLDWILGPFRSVGRRH